MADDTAFAGMDAATCADPGPMFAALREHAPVMTIPGQGVIVSRFVDVDHVLHDPELFCSKEAAELGNIRPLIPLSIDAPEHRTYRKILDPLFSPRATAAMTEPVTRLVNELIDGFIAEGEVDFADRFSIPFPSQVFLELLGLPQDELPTFLAMKDGIIRPGEIVGDEPTSDAAKAHQRATADSIYAYFGKVLDERAVEGRDDLLTRFLTTEIDGDVLTREDILDICFLFLIAGLDTVTATLSCMFAYLVSHPERRDALVADPSLIDGAIEEMLRYETPVMGVARMATRDTEIAGCPVTKGDLVIAMIGSANLDDAMVEDASKVRFDRDSKRHLSFGGGVHRCLGSHLARLELRIALTEWHRRIPDYAVAPGHDLVFTPPIRTIDHFPMVFTPSS
jgi:cytochrome P450